MARRTVVLLALGIATALLLVPAMFDEDFAQSPPPHVPGELLIKFRPEVPAAGRHALQADLNATRLHTFTSGAQHWRLNGTSRIEDVVDDIRNDTRVEYVDLNHLGEFTVSPNDTEYSLQWPPPQIEAATAWDIETGANVHVAVIDSGTAFLHVDLVSNKWVNDDPVNGIDDDGNGFIDDHVGWDFISGDNNPAPSGNNHGTAVAGIIGATLNNNEGVVGVAPDVRLMIFRTGEQHIDEAATIKAIDYAVMERAQVINASWRFLGCGGPPPCHEPLRKAIEYAWNKEIVFVAGAGNEDQDIDDPGNARSYPANFTLPNIIGVAGTDQYDDKVSDSSYGPVSVDLAAPGTQIRTTDFDSNLPIGDQNKYVYFAGTSSATPHVSGAAALLYARKPGIPAEIVKARLLENVDIVLDDGIVATDGRLNARRPLLNLDTNSPANMTSFVALGSTNNSVTLQWTATGDDGSQGTAKMYQLRHQDYFDGPLPWLDCQQVEGEPVPAAQGTVQGMTVGDLPLGKALVFRLRAYDEWGNGNNYNTVICRTSGGACTTSFCKAQGEVFKRCTFNGTYGSCGCCQYTCVLDETCQEADHCQPFICPEACN